MNHNWAAPNLAGTTELFETLHSGLKIELIATPRKNLMTCRPNELVSAVIQRNTEQYDYIPVIEDDIQGDQAIIGLLNVADHTSGDDVDVGNSYVALSEDFIIGADSSILNVIKDADVRPCRLIVSGGKISGLVSLSDLQRLPVRATLFALITGFEITMMEAIKRIYRTELHWMNDLSHKRKTKIERQKKRSKATDTFVDTLLFTQFSDKKILLKKYLLKGRSKTSLDRTLGAIQRLRDKVAHANEYASTPEHARAVCRTVREMLLIRSEISDLHQSAS